MFGLGTMLRQVSTEPFAVIAELVYYVRTANSGMDARQHTPFREIKLLIISLIMLHHTRVRARASEITAARSGECTYVRHPDRYR